MKRTRLKPMSDKRRAGIGDRRAIREAVFRRDGRCVAWGRDRFDDRVPPCSGDPFTAHHLRKASAGGGYSMTNLVTLCAGHNTWVEDAPNLAHEHGLVVRLGDL